MAKNFFLKKNRVEARTNYKYNKKKKILISKKKEKKKAEAIKNTDIFMKDARRLTQVRHTPTPSEIY